VWRFEREENVEGIVSVKRLLGKDITRSLVS
jgi:hypothetical protein